MENTEKEKKEWYLKLIHNQITELRKNLEYLDDLPDNVDVDALDEINSNLDICLSYWNY